MPIPFSPAMTLRCLANSSLARGKAVKFLSINRLSTAASSSDPLCVVLNFTSTRASGGGQCRSIPCAPSRGDRDGVHVESRPSPSSPPRQRAFPRVHTPRRGLPASECIQHWHMTQTKRSPENPARFRSWAGSQPGRAPVPGAGPCRASSDRWRGRHPWCAVQPRDPPRRLRPGHPRRACGGRQFSASACTAASAPRRSDLPAQTLRSRPRRVRRRAPRHAGATKRPTVPCSRRRP